MIYFLIFLTRLLIYRSIEIENLVFGFASASIDNWQALMMMMTTIESVRACILMMTIVSLLIVVKVLAIDGAIFGD